MIPDLHGVQQPTYLAGVNEIDMGDLRAMRRRCTDLENGVSYVRRMGQGRLDVLANIAGVVRFAHTPEMSESDWNLVLGVNLSGPFYLSQESIPHLLETHGNIVNVASNAGLMGQAYTAAYCASKGGLVQLTRSLAMEFMKKPLRVNAVCPAGTDTQMNKGIDFPDDVDWKLIGRFTGDRGFAQPSDIASAIAYVASDEAKMVHGSIFSVDQGMMAG